MAEISNTKVFDNNRNQTTPLNMKQSCRQNVTVMNEVVAERCGVALCAIHTQKGRDQMLPMEKRCSTSPMQKICTSQSWCKKGKPTEFGKIGLFPG